MTGAAAGAGPQAHQAALAAAIADVLGRLDAHAGADPRDRHDRGDPAGRKESRRQRQRLSTRGNPPGQDVPQPGGRGGPTPPVPADGQHTAAAAPGSADQHTASAAPPGTAAPPSALETVGACFGLTSFERDVLVLAAAAELDATTGARCAAASADARPYPTFSLALATLDEPHWSALTPVAPLRRWHLVELDDETSLTHSRLRADERILHFLAGVPYLDPRLRGLVRPAEPPPELPPAYRTVAAALAACWSGAPGGGPPHAEITGADVPTRREIAAAAADEAGLDAYAIRAADLPAEATDRDALARLWEREAILLPAVLVAEADEAERLPLADEFCGRLGVPVALSCDRPAPAGSMRAQRLTVPPLGPGDQLRLWRSALDGLGGGPAEVGLRQLVTQFSLPAHVIRAAGAAVHRELGASADGGSENGASADGGPQNGRPTDGGPENGTHADGSQQNGAAAGGGPADVCRLAWRAGLAQARIALDELGQRVEPRAGWDDLVVPGQQRTTLREIAAHVRQRATVYQDWGFESVLRRGLGVTALFAGTSGTGKTLAAEVVAGELGLDLFVIDLSQVVSKYIGETEKNLRRVFDAAERGGAVLLFDEADALFGKRSEVKDSHDRYANIEVSYLLMRMEAYRGLAILTTNMKKALDQAFMRRLRFVVEFPFPDAAQREQIWRRVIPERVPVRGVEFGRLAQLTVPGGSIRNIALAAAFLAADQGASLQMRHLLAASRAEYLKLERPLPAGEVAGWE